jgi:CRISPR-associated protein Cmr3
VTDAWAGYHLVPEDVLFFRDGRPSSMGDDHYLRSLFLPYPSTLYGMARTRRLLEDGYDLSHVSERWWQALPAGLRAEIGEWGAYGTLKLRGPWLVRERPGNDEGEILLPAPLDLHVEVGSSGGEHRNRKVTRVLRLLRATEGRSGGEWSHSLAVLNPSERQNDQWIDWHSTADGAKEPKAAQGWFLGSRGIQHWLAGHTPSPEDFVDSRTLWSVEPRTGLGLQAHRRISQDRMLYTFGFIRLARGVSIGFELSGGELETGVHVRLGGENRVAFLQEGPSLSKALQATPQPAGEGVYCLIAPALFERGSVPEAHVSAAVVSDSVRVGGWNLASPGPKPLWRAAPAGSVYYIEGPSPGQLSSLSMQAKEGFGVMLRGSRPRR